MSLDLFCFCIANILITYCKRLSSWHLQRCDFQETQKLYHLCPQGNVDASYWTSLSLITSSRWLWINVLNTSRLSALIWLDMTWHGLTWLDMAWQGKNSNYCNFEALDEALKMPVAFGSSFCETQMLLSETSSVSSWFSYVFLPTVFNKFKLIQVVQTPVCTAACGGCGSWWGVEPTSARNWSSWQTSDLAKTSPSLQDSTSAYCFIMFYLSVNDIANGVTNDVSLFLSYLSLSPLDSSVELCLKSEGITAVLAGPSRS